MFLFECYVINWQVFSRLHLDKTEFFRAIVRRMWKDDGNFYLQDYFFSESPTEDSDGCVKVSVCGKELRYYYQTI